MCGICGKIYFDSSQRIDSVLIKGMMDVMHHRGPDDDGIYLGQGIGLGHRRLSIIDLNTGKQPICNENESVWVVFNGEIYNYRELRSELSVKGHIFKTRTDTEVIVHLYEEFGEGFVGKLRGMFGIALWDSKERVLILARDRVGIKPLYYYHDDDQLIFGSEIKAILADRMVFRKANPQAINLLLSYYYIPGHETLLHGIKKLLPGHYLLVKNGRYIEKEYWDLSFSKKKSNLTLKDAEQETIEIIRQSVRDHMISDVPVGFLLSGGVDSTALLSFAVEETDKEICTFTIGFKSDRFADERQYAALAAKKFGTKHFDMTIDAHEFAEFLPQYVWHMEEPVCEPSAVALYYVSRLAKDHVKVLLSGEGGDEAFAGYPNYRNLVWLERLKKLSGPLRPMIGKTISLMTSLGSLKRFNKYGRLMAMDFENYYFSRASSPLTFMNTNARDFYTPEFYDVVRTQNTQIYRQSLLHNVEDQELLDKMLYIDTKTWLVDDLLLKADKITMANSIELRVPLLDHGVLGYAASLPTHFKLNRFTTKYILKKAFEGRVPDEILYRKKTGFPVPYDQWMSNELNGYVRDILLDERATGRGYFQPGAISRMIDANGRRPTYSKEIFLLVALELWHRCFIDHNSPWMHGLINERIVEVKHI
jgi:asparagine synthase (glutamine-hydrolysing)